MCSTLKFSKIVHSAFELVRATPESVGLDVKSIEEVDLGPWDRVIVRTGIAVEPPKGTYVRIASRSGLASKGISVQGGVIDPDYTGEIKVILYNHSNDAFQIKPGMKIAQLITEKVVLPSILQVDNIETTSSRGDSGFGSSGL